MQKPSEWYVPVAAIIERFTTRWAVAGALAAAHYRATERLTADADLCAAWHDGLVPALEGAGYTVRQVVDPSIDHPHLLICRRGEERIDILIPTVPYQELALDRAAEEHVLTIEDVIIHKLIAWRPKDIDDIASILTRGSPLDRSYIERWAHEWEVTERWYQATRAR